MDSVSHIRVANLLMDYVEQTCGVTFDPSGFVYGNLKPDLTGTYLTKRHNPSIMMDEVMDKIRVAVWNNDKVMKLVETNKDEIMSEVLAEEVVLEKADGYEKEWNINGEKVMMSVMRK